MSKDVNSNELEQKLFSRNFTKLGLDLNPVVSLAVGIFVLIFSLYALINISHAQVVFEKVRDFIITNFDWTFILASNFFIIISLYMAFSKLGSVKIGGVHSETEFSNFAWYSMLISAGMGIGLMFWSVGEPLWHFESTPPVFQHGNPTYAAMATTFFHWGLHPWGIYAFISLALAFFAYNKNLPLSLRSVFYPLFGDKVFGVLGDIIDSLAVIATLFGLATSLGLGVQQINSGLNYLVGLPISIPIQVVLIVLITFVATISVVSGIDKGVRFLSELNMKLAAIFMISIFILGPTGYILRVFSNSLGLYLNDFLSSSFFVSITDKSWQGSWTVFYLAWWISWSPFVGLFIARISKGRTIREFVLAVLIIPSLLSFIWLSVFGGTAISINSTSGGALFDIVRDNLPVALFEMITYLDIPTFLSGIFRVLLSVVATLLIISYFVTSSDSGSLVVDKITSGGKLKTSSTQRVFWAVLEGLVAAVLLVIGGERALQALQTAVISTGLPFAIVLIVMSVSLIKNLQISQRKQKRIRDINQFKKMLKAIKEEEKQKQKG
ncbi:choline/glycine/proline betaine transport protein [Anaerobranca californiensis DSM 14826]|uniref:Choline/glycine/proline betaine transport protein n=1 Tax=Anaerobranca californiensis DSM 14826 TaxID=1120989 RepID=A0A1M6NRN2_9FIRM|nr:BCCT family transporter [Anaerobranca californiensis]SHJ98278.1 choline/glycine/proline betaine transport protein [Anaerobranca californiensis DSM 14826]